jgi:hypothetical protein
MGSVRAASTSEELRQNVDLLNYFFYLLSHPGASIPVRPRVRPAARQAVPADPGVGVVEAGRHLTEWSPTLSRL